MFVWGLLVGLMVALVIAFIMNRALEGRMKESFKALASDAIHANSEMLATAAHRDLTGVVEPLRQNLDTLNGHVRALEQARAGAYQSLEQQLGQMREAHVRLQETTLTLSQALRSPTVRGRWGEMQLRRVVEMAGMESRVAFDEQVSGEQGRPDLVVHLPQGGALPVDSKVPLEAYLNAMETTDSALRRQGLLSHAQAVRSRIVELGRKQYWSQFDRAPDFVVMFVPNEACLGAAYEVDPELLTYAMANKVLLASPVTLLALLRTIAYGWQQHQVTENARVIAQEGKELAGRLDTFVERFAAVGKSLDKTVDSYNAAVGSFDRRLRPAARRFQELQVSDALPGGPEPVDRTPRMPQ
jgi:DNA recombination protein RmuC